MQHRMMLISMLSLVILTAQADIYRSENANGNTTFSDRPSRGAERVEVDNKPYRYRVAIKRVVDGDTLLLKNGERVRLIGINTPEVDSRFRDAEPGGDRAKQMLKAWLQDKDIWLEYDSEQWDKYDRRLVHIFSASGDYINARLLRQGLAVLTLYPPNLRYAQKLIAAQQEAEQAKRGIWAMPFYKPQSQSALMPGQNYRGWQRWQLTPTTLTDGRSYAHLRVSDALIVDIPKNNLGLFPPLKTYLNQRLEVRGWLHRRGKQHHMLVRHPSAIVRLSPEAN